MSSQKDESQRNRPDGFREPENGNRRRLIKALSVTGVAAGAVSLPQQWTRPVVDSVSLPAHAQTTAQGFFGQGDLTGIVMNLPDLSRDALQRIVHRQEQRGLLDSLIAPAHANDEFFQSIGSSVFEPSSSSFAFASAFLSESNFLTMRFDLRFEEGENFGLYCERTVVVPLCQEGNVNLKSYKTLRLTNCDELELFDGVLQARIKSIGPDSAIIEIRGDGGDSDTLFLARGGNPPNCPDCQSRGEKVQEFCGEPEPEPDPEPNT